MLAAVWSAAAVAAAGPECRAWRTFFVGGRAVELCRLERPRAIVDRECAARAETKGCEALRALGRASFKRVKGRSRGGMNPGSPVCADLGGKPVVGRSGGSENCLCRFGDESFATCGTLSRHATGR